LPKSQLQGHFGLCPAAENPRYLSCHYTVARQKSQSEEAAINHYKHLSPFFSPTFKIKNHKNSENDEHSYEHS